MLRHASSLWLLAFLTLAVVPCDAQTATLKAQFIYGGVAPQPKPIALPANANCGNVQLVNEELLVNQTNNGIKNVAFYLYTGRGGSKIDVPANTGKTVTLANSNCRFDPHFVVLQVGDTLKITNPDPMGHNANITFFANVPVNPLIPPGQFVDVKIIKPEPGITKAVCNIHPWMLANILALDHPFAAVSDDDGNIQIDGLPSGKALVFRVYHEKASKPIKTIELNGQAQELKKNQYEITLKPGMNDLGVVTIPAAAL